MANIERLGPHFIAFSEEGLRTIVKISSIQVVAEVDCAGDEIQLTTVGRSFRVRGSLQEVQDALTDDWRFGLFRRADT